MPVVAAALVVATLASGAWCVGGALAGLSRARPRWGIRAAAVVLSLAAVVAIAAGLRFSLIPAHHAMYVDEPWYAEAACNLARLGRLVLCEETWSGRTCAPYEKASGWPVFLAPWTVLFGCATSIGIHVNRVLGSATVLFVAMAARSAGAAWWQCVLAAAVLAIHPVHVAWSATGETNVPAAAALLAGLCGALAYVRTGRFPAAALAVSALGLSCAIRPESALPSLAAASVVALAGRSRPPLRVLAAAIAVVSTVAAALSGMGLWAMNESLSGGSFLSWRSAVRNVALVAGSESSSVHGILLGAAIMGALSRRRADASLLLCTAIAGALAALAYDRFHERMLLGATVALAPLTAFSFDWIPPVAALGRGRAVPRGLAGGAFALALAALWAPVLRSASRPPETQLLETRVASRAAALPPVPGALLITEQPTVLAASGVEGVMSTAEALRTAHRLERRLDGAGPVYFLCDMYCEADFQGVEAPGLCGLILERFALAPVMEERLDRRTYGLYRIVGTAGPGSTPPPCPVERE